MLVARPAEDLPPSGNSLTLNAKYLLAPRLVRRKPILTISLGTPWNLAPEVIVYIYVYGNLIQKDGEVTCSSVHIGL